MEGLRTAGSGCGETAILVGAALSSRSLVVRHGFSPCHRVTQSRSLPFLLLASACALSSTLVVPGLGLKIARTAVVTNAAAGAVAAIAPGAGLDRTAMPATEPLTRWWNFEAQHATLGAIPRPPAAPQNRLSVSFAQPLPGRWHLCGPITFRAACSTMASAPVTRPDRPAVNLAQPFLA